MRVFNVKLQIFFEAIGVSGKISKYKNIYNSIELTLNIQLYDE
jgi:hypothetical protein